MGKSYGDFSARRRVQQNVLPKVLDADPSQWTQVVRQELKELPEERRKAFLQECRFVVAPRKKLLAAVWEGVHRVQDSEFGGEYAGDYFKGVILFGSFTGKRMGEPDERKALDARTIGDIDYVPVITEYYPQGFLSYVSEEFPRRVQERLRKENMQMPVNSSYVVRVPKDIDGNIQPVVEDLETVRIKLKHFNPEPWHFIGNPSTKEIIAKAIEQSRHQ